MKKELFVYCAGGFGREVMDIAERQNTKTLAYSRLSFIDDITMKTDVNGFRITNFHNLMTTNNENDAHIVIANGEPSVRRILKEKIASKNYKLGRVIDPSVIISNSSVIDQGVIIAPLCSVSSNALIKENVAVNTMSIIGHDVVVGENAVISSMVNIGGATTIGEQTYVGMGALIKEGLKIGSGSIIGMGSVVYNDIPDGVIALGNPARVMRKNVNEKVFR